MKPSSRTIDSQNTSPQTVQSVSQDKPKGGVMKRMKGHADDMSTQFMSIRSIIPDTIGLGLPDDLSDTEYNKFSKPRLIRLR